MTRKIIGALCLAAVLAACQKMTDTPTEQSILREKAAAAVIGFSDMPVVKDGMLVFKDTTHIAAYMDFLQKSVDAIDPKDTTRDEHSVLNEIEKSIGFTSIRSISHETFLRQDAIGWKSVKDIPEEHFITSNDVKSVLNSQLEVQVGNQITHYINKDFVVNVDAGQPEILNGYRNLKPDATIEDIMDVDYKWESTSVMKLTDAGGDITRTVGHKPTGIGPERVQFPFVHAPDICNNPNNIKFQGLALRDPSYLKAYFVVYFGDGQTKEIWAEQSIPFFGRWKAPDFYHTYATLGPKTICVKAYYAKGSALVDEKCMTINIPPNAGCQMAYKETEWQYGYESSTRAWGGKLKVERIHPWFSSPKARVVGITKSVAQKSNGDWHHVKGNIGVEIACDAKNNYCTVIDHLVGSSFHSKSKEETVHRTGSGEFLWGTATSVHYMNGKPVYVSLKSCQ